MLITAAGTSGSRLLGLVRDQLIAGFFGTGGFAAAFIIAFQIPNLFRRLLGEGALTSALMPVMTQERRLGGNARAFAFFNLVISRVAPWMFAITVLFCAGALAVAFLPESWLAAAADVAGADGDVSRHRLAAKLTALCMPYMPMICIAALFTAALNMLGRFTVTALSAIWLNLSMIFALGVLGWHFGETPQERVVWLCAGALFGGALQLCVPAAALYRSGWRPRVDFATTESWDDLKALFLPALVGAGVHQHPLVAIVAGKLACIQQLPLLAAKGQVVDLFFHFGVAQPVYKVRLGVKIHQHTADIKNNAFIHNCCLACIECFSQIFSIVYHNRVGAFHPF